MVELGDDLTVSITGVRAASSINVEGFTGQGRRHRGFSGGANDFPVGALDMACGADDLPYCGVVRDQVEV